MSTYALFFGAFYGLMEFIPYIGPIIGPLPRGAGRPVLHPISAVWVILLFVGLQQLEGHVVAPQVFRISLRINPILVILALLIGFKLYGIAGALLALPIAAVVRQTVVYLRRHLVLEPWGTLGSGVIANVGGAIAARTAARRAAPAMPTAARAAPRSSASADAQIVGWALGTRALAWARLDIRHGNRQASSHGRPPAG